MTASATASPTSRSTGPVRRRTPAPPARRRLRLLADLRIADRLRALGTSVPVDTARRLVAGAAAGAVLLAFAAGIVAVRAAAVLAPGPFGPGPASRPRGSGRPCCASASSCSTGG
ncbi:hypothetical protein [Kocuria sp. NPDC057446]|uniref:hypothetical protein n=1 Tax=Kocuria sp. NPDC057446 TaxID=3346137 RepID=UPI00367C3358